MSSSARGASGALVARGGRNPEFHSRPEVPPARSAAGGEATPPITGGWDHGGLGKSVALRLLGGSLMADEPRRSFHAPPESTCGMVVKASTKPWPRRLGSSILRALPPRSQVKSSQVGPVTSSTSGVSRHASPPSSEEALVGGPAGVQRPRPPCVTSGRATPSHVRPASCKKVG